MAEQDSPTGLAEALVSVRAGLDLAAQILGMPPRDPDADREAARRVHAAMPGVPLPSAFAAVKALRAMGWTPADSSVQRGALAGAAAQRAAAGHAEAKLAAVEAASRAHLGREGSCCPHFAEDILAIVSGEGTDRG